MERKTPADFEWIEDMTREFKQAYPDVPVSRDAAEDYSADYWVCRFLLAIAQQLSVIAANLKDRG